MKKSLLCFILSVALVLSFAGYSWSQDTIMQPDRETRLKWFQWHEEAPEAPIDPAVQATIPLSGSLSLLSHLQYTPAQRNQGSCGNCWAWAGQGLMGIDLDIQEGIKDRLSVQYINSCHTTAWGYACCGAWLQDVANFYNGTGQAIPWSNSNANWQDGARSCGTGSPAVVCGLIDPSPNYPINSMSVQRVTTQGVTQATAISNIKAQLHANKAVWFGFFLPRGSQWTDFRAFWNGSPENVTWNIDQGICGTNWDSGGGGHAVLCVGYNDDDAQNPYWIMLNSWGTASGGRPNGLFRIDMDMNYSCQDYYGDYTFFWETATIDWGAVACCTKPTPVVPSGSGAPERPTYTWSCSGSWDYFQVYVQNLSTGTTHGSGWVMSSANTWTHPGTSPALPWGSYRWWVRVWDSDCGYSAWSDPMDFAVGSCCPKPTLGVNTSGADPVISWSCDTAQWQYAYVYVLNTSTGAVRTSGWLDGGQVTQWTATGLPWGNYRAWVRVWHSQCGYSQWSDPVDFTNGSCTSKPTLQTPIGDPPIFNWTGSGDWQYAYVYVLNTSTGAVRTSGWLDGGQVTQWTATGLAWGSYRAWVQVWHSQCGYSQWSDPVDFTNGQCCAKPTLGVNTSGADPVFGWSCGVNGAEWQYAYVYVYNLSTGAVRTSGWLNGGQVYQWTATGLAWGSYRAWVQVWHSQCGYSQWSDPVDFNNGSCTGKPTLQTPSGNQPTYVWDGGGGVWTYFWVYVRNLSTGAYYGSGWVSSSLNTWTQTNPLPPGNYRAWVQVWHPQCGYSAWSDPQDWCVGAGANYASLRFYNNLVCGTSSFTATLTMCGQALSSVSGNWSTCKAATPATCSWTLYANAGACGTLNWSGSFPVAAGSVYSFLLDLDEYDDPALYYVMESGDCCTPTPWSVDTAGRELLMKVPLKGFNRAQ